MTYLIIGIALLVVLGLIHDATTPGGHDGPLRKSPRTPTPHLDRYMELVEVEEAQGVYRHELADRFGPNLGRGMCGGRVAGVDYSDLDARLARGE